MELGNGYSLSTMATASGTFPGNLGFETWAVYTFDLPPAVERCATLVVEVVSEGASAWIPQPYGNGVVHRIPFNGTSTGSCGGFTGSLRPGRNIVMLDTGRSYELYALAMGHSPTFAGLKESILGVSVTLASNLTPLRAPICGNSIVELGEECDDGTGLGCRSSSHALPTGTSLPPAQCGGLSQWSLDDDNNNRVRLDCANGAFGLAFYLTYTPAGGASVLIARCPFECGDNVWAVFHSGDSNRNGRPDRFIRAVWQSTDTGQDDDGDGMRDTWKFTTILCRGGPIVTRRESYHLGTHLLGETCLPGPAVNPTWALAYADSGRVGSVPEPQLVPSGGHMGGVFALPCDLDHDGDCDCNDVAILDSRLGLCVASPTFNPEADLNGNGCIDAGDARLIRERVGLTTIVTGCGGATLDASGTPCIGNSVSYQVVGRVGATQLLWLGFQSVSVPLCSRCTLGTETSIVFFQSSGALSVSIPNDPLFRGATWYVQGADVFGASGGCSLGGGLDFTVTDTIRTTVGG